MKIHPNKTKIAGFLMFAAFFFCNLNFGVSALAQQELTPHRAVAEKPTPTVYPTPFVKPSVSPTPNVAAAIPVPMQTISDLQARIRAALARPEIRRGQIGVKIQSLDTNKTIFEENGEKYFMPASNMKSFTVAAALEKLSPDFRFVTSVYAPAMPDASGVLRGDLTVFGRGDVSLATAFNDGDYYKGIDALASKIAQAGVKRIEGNLVGDESYFTGGAIPSGWEWDDLQWYYGAEVSALPVMDNSVDLSVKANSAVGAPCAVQILPVNPIVRLVNRCATTAAGAKRDLHIEKKLDQNVLEVSGTMPLGDKEYKGSIAVSRPAELFLALLRQRLTEKGVVINGQNRVVGAREKSFAAASSTANSTANSSVAGSAISSSPAPFEIARLESPPLFLIAAKTMKPSQNLYTEIILRALGERMKTLATNGAASTNAATTNVGATATIVPSTTTTTVAPMMNLAPDNPFFNPKAESAERGLFAVQNFLRQDVGIAPDAVLQYDGSGLSRHNLITPNASAQLYAFMSRSRNASVWRDALPIAGVDGTLKNRLVGTAAATNARAKTGTIDQVSALSGYVTTAAGERLVFSIIVNDVADGRLRQAVIDEIVVALANFNGKTF
ncbi:MAG: D-alanyl-D-alanine carboxypeptidase/D-alanyl-D-alanine-endopeptidase [Acidobacteria bacterium]|nr:D-alanyl-D-alanine carboxypeptidase/D-alanyl-D-alanine-endopeptidase [Acidobacteriota bacterium]